MTTKSLLAAEITSTADAALADIRRSIEVLDGLADYEFSLTPKQYDTIKYLRDRLDEHCWADD